MFIQHNMAAMTASRQLGINSNNRAKRARNLGSGYKINIAADNAAGLSISEKMRGQIRGLEQGSRNAQDGISLIQTGDGSLAEVQAILQRINVLTVQAANDTNTVEDRDKIQEEINQLKEEINNIGNNTEFNTIKIFKPTNVPEIKGNPTDILVYHEDYNGSVREGGIIYNGTRYAYEEMNLDYEGNNIKAGTYTIQVEGQNGDLVNINLIFDGGSRVPSGREYELETDENGISIDGILHAWNTMTDDNGRILDPGNITAGTFKFKHAGLTISFETDDNMDLDTLIGRLQKGGLTTYTLKSSNVTSVTQRVNPSVSITDLDVTAANSQYIPGNRTSNTSRYEMHADDTGLYMFIPADQSHGQGRVEFTHRTWEELGITDEDFMETDFPDNSGLNPDSTVTGGESSRIYTYTDDITGISVNFTIDSEVSKNELISSVNNWAIRVTTNNKMVFTPSGDSSISAGSHSSAFDAYGTQYLMGRDMENQMTLQSGMDIIMELHYLSQWQIMPEIPIIWQPIMQPLLQLLLSEVLYLLIYQDMLQLIETV